MSSLASQVFVQFIRDLPRRELILNKIYDLRGSFYLNTNLLLYGIWYALHEQGRLRKPEFKKLQTALHPWHERIVVPLEHLAVTLRQFRVMKKWVLDEIEQANDFEQQMLAQAVSPIKKTRRNFQQQLLDAAFNLAGYYKIMRIYMNEDLRKKTIELLQIFFPDFSEIQIIRSLDQSLQAAQLEESGFTQLSLV